MSRRGLRAALLVVGAAALLLPAGPASAAVGPAVPVRVDVGQVRATCAGDTLRVVTDVDASAPTEVVVRLQVQGDGGFSPVGRGRSVSVDPGRSRLSVDLDASGAPAGTKLYRAEVLAGGKTALSPALQVEKCAPAAVVPEVPAAALVPLTLLATGAVVVGVRRRRA